MICPRCLQDDITEVNGTHYICNNPDCSNEDGTATQFTVKIDDHVRFPYNQIFNGKSVTEFIRTPMLSINK